MASPTIGYAILPITPSLRGMDAEIRRQLGDGKTSQTATAAGKQVGDKYAAGFRSGLKDLEIDSQSLTAFGAKALAVGGVAAFGLGKAAAATDSLNAAISANRQVFGDASADIEKWAEGSADAIGLSTRAATEAATAFGAFGKQAGLEGSGLTKFATDLADLAADLAAFDNSTVEEALSALQSGLTGQVMPLRRYQILLSETAVAQKAYSEGIAESGSQLTEQEKVLARQALIFDQASDKIGQFQREYGELNTQQQIMSANWEDAQAKLGQALLPALTDAAKGINSLLQSFQKLDPGVQAFIAKFAAVGAVGTVAVGGLSLAAGAGMRLADAYGRMRVAADRGNKALGMTSRVAVGAGKALGVAGLAFAAYAAADALNQTTRDAVAAETAILNLSNASSDADIGKALFEGSAAAEGWPDEAFDFYKRLTTLGKERPSVEFGDFIVEIDNLQRHLAKLKDEDPEALAKAIGYLNEQMSYRDTWGLDVEGQDAFRGLQDDIAGYVEYLDAAGRAQVKAGEEAARLERETEELAGAQKALDDATGHATRRLALMTIEFDAGRAAADAFAGSLERATPADNLLKAGLGVSSAMRDLRDGIFGQSDAATEATKSTDSLATALDRVNRELEWSDPAMTAAAIGYARLAAAASAFRDSMSRNVIAGQVASALTLGDTFRDFSKTMRRLPAEIDMVSASTGRYRPRQVEAIRTMLQLGEATADYLASMLEAGKSQAQVRSEADRLRAAYIDQFRAAGMTESQIRAYIDTLGLTPEAVETAIRLSGVEAARFEIQSYLQLLEGRIPEAVAASVTAKIAAGDLESAAQELAALAASNPVVIPVDIDTTGVENAKREIGMELPQSFDFAKAALGGYTAEQERGLEAVLKLGDATKDYLAELVGSGKGDQAIAEAERLREEYRRQFEQFGITGAAFDEYADKLLGLDVDDIRVAIDVASFAEDVFKIETLLSLLESDLSVEEKYEIAAALSTDDFDTAFAVLEGKVSEWESKRWLASVGIKVDEDGNWSLWEQWFGGVKLPAKEVHLDTGPAEDAADRLGYGLGRAVATMPLDADTSAATDTTTWWRFDQEGRISFVPVGADTKNATDDVDGFRLNAGSDPLIIQVDGDLRPIQRRFAEMFPRGSLGDQMFNWNWGKAATGGLITGPGGPTSDSIPMLLSNGEYVINAAAVRAVGVDTLDAINAGNLAQPVAGSGRAGAQVNVDYRVTEAKDHPTAADVAREVSLAAQMAGL